MKTGCARTIGLMIMCVAALSEAVWGAGFTYSMQRKEIKAGVVILPMRDPSTGRWVYTNPPSDPYVFYVMDRRTDLKPAGWEFVNPLAPSCVTPDINSRWRNAYALGQPVAKDLGCYWEVKLDAPFEELAQFDVLLVGIGELTGFRRNDREKLRKLADAGGVVWIENCGGGRLDSNNPFFIRELDFKGGGSGPVSVPNPSHPLVLRPFQLSWEEINTLGLGRAGARYLSGISAALPDQRYFASVIVNSGGRPVVSGAQCGSGRVVAVAEGIGDAISDPVGGSSHRCDSERVAFAHSEDLKFAYNIVSWGTEHTTFHKNARHTGYSFGEIGAPLALMWEYTTGGIAETSSSPAILDEMVFYVDGGGVLHAFDIAPARDRDGDGKSDDGIADLSNGAPYDELWNAPVGLASSPTAAYVPVGGGGAIPAVFVTSQDGRVTAFNALTGKVEDSFQMKNGFAKVNGEVIIPAPTYADGVLYVGDGGNDDEDLLDGYLYARDYINNENWQWPRNVDQGDVMGPILSSPTVGYFRDPMSGAVDQVVYVASRGAAPPSVRHGAVQCFVTKVFNEVLSRRHEDATYVYYAIRVPNTAVRDGTWDLYYGNPDGTATHIPQLDAAVQPPTGGTAIFGIKKDFFTANPNAVGAPIIADYELNMVDETYPRRWRQRVPIKTPRLTVESSGILSTPAASAKDILYLATDNASLYAVQQTGRSVPIIKWRWYLGDPYAVKGLGLGDTTPVGSPAVGNDVAYFAVNGQDGGYILAFEADPVFQINVGFPIDARRPVQVRQFDTMNPGVEPFSVTGTVDPGSVEKAPYSAAFTVDCDKGRITIVNFRDPRNSQNELSAAQDVMVRFYIADETGESATPTDLTYAANDPDQKWNNLIWYFPVNFPAPARITSSPMLMGSILYFGCSDGTLHALDVDEIRREVQDSRSVPIPHEAKWHWDQPVTRDAGTPPGPILAAVAGSGGLLAVATGKGLSVLYNPVTLIADSNRLVEIDASGRLTWSCDATTSFASTTMGPGGAISTTALGAVKVPFNRPSVARRAVGGIIAADTGNNRVVHIDKSGKVLWQISEFGDPGGVLPSGAPLTLSAPTDVTLWIEPDLDQKDYLEYHYLIADSGNYRVVEVAAKYDPAADAYRNLLVWSTQTLQQGKRYRYVSARPFVQADSDKGDTYTLRCVISNYDSPESGLEGMGGAIVDISWRIDDPSMDKRYRFGTGLIDLVVLVYEDPQDGRRYKIVNPTFLNREFRTKDEFLEVVADANGIYVVEYVGKQVTRVKHYSAKEYLETEVKPLLASYAQLLPNGNVLVTNKATRQVGNPTTEFRGGVFEVQFDNTGKGSIPPNGRLVLTGATDHLEQPSSAERALQ